MKELEKRFLPAAEIRLVDGDKGPVIEGYAAVFNSRSVDFGGLFEQIAPGAFKRTLSEGADVRALVDHDSSRILGRTKSRTLTAAEDERGLKVRIEPPSTSVGKDILESIRRGDVDGMSFAFRARKDQWEELADGTILRTLLDVDLRDVSVVTFPAYPDTSVAVRSEMTASLEAWRAAHPPAAPAPPAPTPEELDEKRRAHLRAAELEM